ncbi:MAG: MBOAT family protein [Clostridia bacterium]|nr:MBOAT family protein [Clostridia bacterium]MCI1999301.1 MBOAT family protein [Clostridia bacterium]MCI2014746.1 MBOAT family protein [Clostridia bacterium]
MLLIASYYFYMCWKPTLIVLIVFLTFVNYCASWLIYKAHEKRKKKSILIVCLIINFGLLFIFKYFNFAVDSIYSVLGLLGLHYNVPEFDIILPMGISFYTFQAAAYTIDVYREDVKPVKNYVVFSLFITFFPQLVAGPIERSKNLIKQFYKKHRFYMENVLAGLEIMLWGYFKKVVIADRIAVAVNTVFNNCEYYSGLYLVIAMILFTFQIYCDFSGYSDIAKGSARVLGFDLMTNFDRPFMSKSIKEFWRRWHISLSTWFLDYVYIPLGGNRCSRIKKYRNLFITFLVSGMWHGASWTFIIWGALHGVFQIIGDMTRGIRERISHALHFDVGFFGFVSAVCSILITFMLVAVAFVFFRANTIQDAFYIFSHMFWDFRKWITPQYLYEVFTNFGLNIFELKISAFAIIVLIVAEILGGKHINETLKKWGFVPEVLFYSFILIFILTAGVFYNAGEFIYFQF